MLYLVIEPDNGNGYHYTYNNELKKYLDLHNIQFMEIAVEKDYLCQANIDKVNSIQSKSDDIWLFSYAQNPLIEKVYLKPGRKFAHVHGLEALLYEPAVLHGYRLYEEVLLYFYDGLFVNSEWAYSVIKKAYPGLTAKTIVTGFPLDVSFAEKFKHIEKENKTIAFNQRFDMDKLHMLEIYLCEKLIDLGYTIFHICTKAEYERTQSERESKNLLIQAVKMGVQVLIAESKDDYYEKLAKAKFTVTTSIADTLSVCVLEAAALGSIPIAPDLGPFSEYIPAENLYKPFNVEQLIDKVMHENRVFVNLEKYSPEKVFGYYMKCMGVI